MDIFFTLFYQPIFNLLIFITAHVGGSIGWAIVLITIAIRAVLYPLTEKALSAQRSMQQLQPKINELKVKHKDNKEVFSRELMNLYKEQKVNPFSSCVTIIVQLPILWALYRAFQVGLSNHTIPSGILYSFVASPQTISSSFLWMNLATPSIWLALFAGATQYLQARSLPRPAVPQPSDGAKDEKMLSMMNQQMMYIFPVMTVIIGMSIPAGLSLYWGVSTLLLFAQQVRAMKKGI